MKIRVTLAVGILLSGCASHLVVFDHQGKVTSGVPFRAPVLVKVETTTTYEPISTAGENRKYCTKDTETGIESLPLGDQFYANIDPATFADGEFGIEFNDKGGLSKVSMNSKASTGVDKVGGFLSTVLPFIRAPKVAANASAATTADAITSKSTSDKAVPPGPAEDMKALYCLKKDTTKRITGRIVVE